MGQYPSSSFKMEGYTTDFYNINVDRRLEGLKNLGISERNQELIQDFVDDCYADDLSEQRILKYIEMLKAVTLNLEIDLDQAEIKDIKKLLAKLKKRYKNENTRHDFKVTLKKFYKWLNGGEEPEITKFFKTTIPRSRTKHPSDLLTEDDVLKMMRVSNVRDQCLLAILWDSGARIGEIGTLKIRDITFDEYGAKLNVNGKTGPRTIRIIWAVTYLMTWLREHPSPDNPEAPLWVNYKLKNSSVIPMKYDSIRMQLIRAAKRAGIKKKVHAHLFRHSRATCYAKNLNEAQLERHFGWVHGSRMTDVYVHLSVKEVDEAILRANGIEIQDDKKPQTIQCPRCMTLNTSNNRFCYRCGAVLDLKMAVYLDDKMKSLEGMGDALELDSESLIRERIRQMIREELGGE